MCGGPPCLRERPLGRCRVEVANIAPDLARRRPKPVARNLSRPVVAAQNSGAWGTVVVAAAGVRDVQKVESGGSGGDPRGFLIMRLSRISDCHGSSSNHCLMWSPPRRRVLGMPVGVPSAGEALEHEVADVESKVSGVDRLRRNGLQGVTRRESADTRHRRPPPVDKPNPNAAASLLSHPSHSRCSDDS